MSVSFSFFLELTFFLPYKPTTTKSTFKKIGGIKLSDMRAKVREWTTIQSIDEMIIKFGGQIYELCCNRFFYYLKPL